MRLLFLVLSILFVSFCTEPKNDKNNDTPKEPFRLLWSYSITGGGAKTEVEPTFINDSLIVISDKNYITCLRSDSGKVKWRCEVPGGGRTTVQNFLFDETQLYCWQYNHGLYAINLLSGEITWSMDSAAYYEKHGLGDNYYYAVASHKIYEVAKSGELAKSINTIHPSFMATTYENNLLSLQGWYDGPDAVGQIECYTPDSHELQWDYYLGHGGFYMCYPVIEDGIMYTGTVWGSALGCAVIALEPATGHEIWQQYSYGCFQIKLEGDYLYYCTGGSVVKLDKGTGNELWQTSLLTTDERAGLAVLGNYVYKCHAGSLFILNAETGDILMQTRGPDNSTVRKIIAEQGKLFLQTYKHLYALEPFNPEVLTAAGNQNPGFHNSLKPESESR